MKTVHMHVDIHGLLRRTNRELNGWIKDPETGRYLDGVKAREVLMEQLALGRLVLPYGKACEGFSFTDGCPGHPEPEA